MPYATRENVENRLPSVEGVTTELFNRHIAEALIDADCRIDEGLCSRYPVPFGEPLPKSITQIAATFAAAFVLRSSTNSEADQKAANEMEASAQRRLAGLLENGIPELENAPDETPAAETVAYHSGFGQTSQIWRAEW